MNEIKKKNRIIQSYVMNLEPGALISEESDIHKVTYDIILKLFLIITLTASLAHLG